MIPTPPTPQTAVPPAAPAPRKAWRKLARIVVILSISLLVLAVAASWYTTTDGFQHLVGGEVVKVLEDSTGGRVELGHLSFSFWHLAI